MPFRPPRVSQNDDEDADAIARFSLDDDDDDLPLDQALQRINERDEEFAARQKAGWDRFLAFADDLTRSASELTLPHLGSLAAQPIAQTLPTSLRGLAKT